MSTARLLQRSLQDVRAQRREDRPSMCMDATDDVWRHDLFEASHPIHARVAESKEPVRYGTKILVDNLHYEMPEQELADVLGTVGPLAKGPFLKVCASG